MSENFTPLNLEKIKNNNINTFILIIANITAFVLAILLFVLIQRKTKENQTLPLTPAINKNNVVSSPTPVLENNLENEPTPTIILKENIKESTITPNLKITPEITIPLDEENNQSTVSPTISQ